MKICHLTSVHPQNDSRIFLKECISLSNNGYEVHFIVPGVENSVISGVVLHSVPKIQGNRFKRMTTTVQAVYKKALEIDATVYHFHDPELIPIGLMLKRKGKKVIYDVHEDVPRQILTKHWIPSIIRSLLGNTFEMFENYSSKKFDLIVTATPHIRDRFVENGCMSIDVNNYPLLREMQIENFSWKDKKDSICYIGGITKDRGIIEMVESLSYLNNIKLFLGGKFSNINDKETVENLEEWEQVVFLGYLNREEVKDVYKNSFAGLVVLHPKISYLDSLPIKMFEYMAAGIPVISSDFPQWKAIINKNKCGICIDPKKPKLIAETIQYLYDNPELAEEMGRYGREAVENKYNWEAESVKLLDAYKKLQH